MVDEEDLPKLAGFNWYVDTNGYVAAWDSSRKRPIYLHRLVLGLSKGEEADHRHHNKLDNRKSELRKATDHQQSGNRRGRLTGRKTSVFKGVHWNTEMSRWRAQIGKKDATKRTRMHFLGYFTDEVEAARAYNAAALAYWGADYAYINQV
jgi:hypothetical protein